MDLIEEFRYLVLAIQREGNKLFAERLRPLGLTPSQAEVLRVMSGRDSMTLSELGGLLVCETTSSPSRLVDRLVAAGLVLREVGPSRRSVSLSLTALGKEIELEVKDAEEQLYAALAPLLDEDQLASTVEALRQVAGAFPAGRALARRKAT
ncbi:winged helix DNA-binding protein [Nocardioides sp. NPDC127503]|uniref:MarR family winged helix-turn-helix transcriptional regulator n=1 Tax=Nocardioides sp. NPDC127503 TaxID=3154516 RepID=UPI00331A3476